MTDPLPEPEPLLVLPVAEPPLVLAVPTTKPPRPQPGFWQAVLLTFGFGVVLFGTLIGIVIVVAVVEVVRHGADSLKMIEGAKEGSVASIPPVLVEALAISFPIGYAAGLLYTVVVLRVIVGRGWSREIGLRRLPLLHLAIGLVALPAFVVLSDALANLLYRAFGMEEYLAQSGGDLGELFASFHWSFAVLAIGLCPGVGEELWCRGFLGRGLVGRYGWLWGVTLTSLFFGMLHLFPPPYVIVTAAMGTCLHFAYIASRSLWVPIAIHTANNSIAGLMAVKVIPSERIDASLAARPGVIVVAALMVLVFCGLAMWRARARVEGEASHRGVMVPPPDSGVVVNSPPHRLFTLAAAGFSAVLVWLLLA